MTVKGIPGFSGYEVDEKGTVWSLPKPNYSTRRPLSAYKDRYGYWCVALYVDGTRIAQKVHALVCLAFHGPKPDNTYQVCHRDGVRDNNVPENIYWGTAQENAEDRNKHGNTLRGSDANGSKLTEVQIVEIRELLKQGLTQQKIALRFGVSQVHISRIKSNSNWKHLK